MRTTREAISDLSKGMEIVRAKGAVKNEIDVVTMANNRLHLIECKTRKFTNKNHANTPGAAAIYRLDTLKEVYGGHSGKAMLISYQKLSRYTEQRAKDLGIYCCSYLQLKQLKQSLYQFIDSVE
jgi:GGDEF domain-containing protein